MARLWRSSAGMSNDGVNFSSAQVLEERSPYAAPLENPSPPAVTRRNFFQLLDGEWKFDLDLNDRGSREGWPIGHEYPGTATWPGSIEAHMARAKEEQKEHVDREVGSSAARPREDKVVAWYERVRAAGRAAARGQPPHRARRGLARARSRSSPRTIRCGSRRGSGTSGCRSRSRARSSGRRRRRISTC